MISWLPLPQDFRQQLRAAAPLAGRTRLDALASLAQSQLSFLETIQLDRALGQIDVADVSGYSRIKIAILASSTVDHLVPGIRVAGLRRKLLFEVHVGGYGQYRQDLLDSSSAIYRFAPQIVLLSLTAREAIGSVPIGATGTQAGEAIQQSVDDLRFLWRQVRDGLHATAIQQTFLDVVEPVFGSHDRQVPGSPVRLVGKLNDAVADAASTDGVLLLDIARAATVDGRAAWFDRTRWLQAKQEIAPTAVPMYGELLARVVAAQRGLSKKCLVLDLDNTLWSGVIGDDGLDGIVLGEGSALGEAHLAVQRYAKQLMDRGIVLAVCSKNDLATAEEVFHKHGEMVLRRADIAAFVANWNDKAENLKAIAAELNLGIDSLVFMDDNPVERARIRESLPEVAVPELPEDAGRYVECLAAAGYFDAIAFTADDLQRNAQYAENAARESLRGSAQSMDEFLMSLAMSVEYGPFSTTDLPRVTQLINKTNQFNPTTRRHTLDEVTRFATAPDHLTLQFRLVDRFGDNGLVSVMVLAPDPDAPDILAIDTWVMSCRVFGRQLELEAMNLAIEAAAQTGVRAIRGEYIPTAKNGTVSDLFEKLGFASVPSTSPVAGATTWVLNVSDYAPQRTHLVTKARQI